jgi:hypothetical protein
MTPCPSLFSEQRELSDTNVVSITCFFRCLKKKFIYY